MHLRLKSLKFGVISSKQRFLNCSWKQFWRENSRTRQIFTGQGFRKKGILGIGFVWLKKRSGAGHKCQSLLFLPAFLQKSHGPAWTHGGTQTIPDLSYLVFWEKKKKKELGLDSWSLNSRQGAQSACRTCKLPCLWVIEALKDATSRCQTSFPTLWAEARSQNLPSTSHAPGLLPLHQWPWNLVGNWWWRGKCPVP